MHDLERLRAVTQHFEELQGLRLVPASVALAFAGLGALWTSLLDEHTGLAVFLALLILGVGGALVLGRWYERRFGVVEPTQSQRRRWALACAGGLVAVTLAALVDAGLRPPVIVFGLTLAGLLFVYWRSLGGPRGHHLVAVGLVAAASLLPLAGLGRSQAAGAVFLALGAAYAVAGVLDHRSLVAAFPRRAEEA
jgi:hypothetical protein